MWFCQNCGNQNRDDSSFCVKCGTPRPASAGGNADVNAKRRDARRENGSGRPPYGGNTAKRPAKRSRKGTLGLIIAAAAAVLSCVLMIFCWKKYMDPEITAERFVEALSDQDSAALYDLFDLEGLSGPFMTKDAFITNEEVFDTQVKAWGGKREGVDYELDLKSKSFSKAKFVAEPEDRDSGMEKMTLQLRRHGFAWKVEPPKDYVYKSMSILAPKDVTLTLDGIELTDGQEPKKRDSDEDYPDSVVYETGDIFGPYHLLEVSGDGIPTTDELVILNGDPINTYGHMNYDYIVQANMPDLFNDYSKSTEDALEQSKKDFDEIMYAASEGKPASAVAFLDDVEYGADYNIESYEKIRDDLMLWYWFTPTKITLSDVKAKARTETNGQYVIITYTGESEVLNGSDTNKNSFSMEMHYIMDDSGDWKFDALYYSGN